MTDTAKRTRKLTQLGLLAALVILFGYLPLKIGAIEMTLMMIPVTLGAILVGPLTGGILGGLFGLISFLQCFGALGFPASTFGNFVFGLNPAATVFMCFVPRILMGAAVGWIFRGLEKIDKTHFISYLVSNVSGALLNTVLFMGSLIIFFWHDAAFLAQMNEWGLSTDKLGAFLVAFVGVNGIVEAAVCAVVGTAVSKGVNVAMKKMRKN
ncbi:MAG: ECF transporter S component [Clostridia bacterium]|nr:ECF transporter S component [Clostridia bacterium]